MKSQSLWVFTPIILIAQNFIYSCQVARDPRFLTTAGEFAEDKFQKQYAFLTDAHKTELRTLREHLKRARKFLASSPREHREEREQEVYRLEQAVKRMESLVNKDRLDQVAHEALGKVTKEEKAKRKQGKGGWWMKEGKCLATIIMVEKSLADM